MTTPLSRLSFLGFSSIALVAALSISACGEQPAGDAAKKDGAAGGDAAKGDAAKGDAGKAADAGGGDAGGAPAGGDTAAAGGAALKATHIATAGQTSCALLSDGKVRCWGKNEYGELGDGKVGEDSAVPVEVTGLGKVTSLVTLGESIGAAGFCATEEDGTVKCWGYGRVLPRDSWDNATTPVAFDNLKGMKAIDAQNGHACIINADDTVSCWGSGAFGALGLGNEDEKRVPTPVPGVTGVVDVAAGGNHTCVALNDGKVKCWGYNGSSQALPGNKDNQLSPVEVPGMTDVVDVEANFSSTCARKKDGKVTCWGADFWEGPKDLEGLSSPKALAASYFMCAVDGDDSLKCFGPNGNGEIGTGDTSWVSKPTAAKGLAGVVAAAPGNRHACAITTDGSVWCWGYNQRGELGDGTLIDSFEPKKIDGATAAAVPARANGWDKLPEAKVTQTLPDTLPEGCTKGEIVAKNKLIKDGFKVASAYATGWDDKNLSVRIATFQKDPKKLYDLPRGAQVELTLSFYKADITKQPPEFLPLDKGAYGMDTKQERYIFASVVGSAATSGIFSWEANEGGNVELTYIGQDFVCGNLALKTKDDEFTGPFVAQFTK